MTLSTEETLRLTVGALMSRTGERQRELAEAIELTQTQISRKQSGQVSWSLADCDRLSAHWDIPVPDLLSGPTHAAALLSDDRLAPGRGTAQPALQVPADPAPHPRDEPTADHGAATAGEPAGWFEADRDPDTGLAIHAVPEPCVLCGVPTPYRGEGWPQHLGGVCPPTHPPAHPATAANTPSTTTLPDVTATVLPDVAATAALALAEPVAAEMPAADPIEEPATPTAAEPTTTPSFSPRRSLSAGSVSGPEVLTARIRANVSAALDTHGGDVEAATKFLDKKRALVDVMELFKLSRVGGRYEHSEFPPTADILKKRTQKGSDEIWEGRPKWRNLLLVEAAKAAAEPIEVVALDMNAAFLSALKAHLPIGRLEPDTTGIHNRKRSGVHRITPPDWDHKDLPNPLGARQEPGPLWVAEPTLRLLLEASRLGLCDAPVIHESLTSGSTEGLAEKLRRALVAARREAIEADEDVMYEYVKSMYSKFVSTIGESTTNRELRRPDWVHIFRAQAFANLWRKAYKLREAGLAAPDSGLAVYEMSGTDELHVRGDWRQVFTEGRAPDQVKLKRTYMIGGR